MVNSRLIKSDCELIFRVKYKFTHLVKISKRSHITCCTVEPLYRDVIQSVSSNRSRDRTCLRLGRQ